MKNTSNDSSLAQSSSNGWPARSARWVARSTTTSCVLPDCVPIITRPDGAAEPTLGPAIPRRRTACTNNRRPRRRASDCDPATASRAVRNSTGVVPPSCPKLLQQSQSPPRPGSHQSSRTKSHAPVRSACQLMAIGRALDDKPFFAQPLGNKLCDLGIVFDDENAKCHLGLFLPTPFSTVSATDNDVDSNHYNRISRFSIEENINSRLSLAELGMLRKHILPSNQEHFIAASLRSYRQPVRSSHCRRYGYTQKGLLWRRFIHTWFNRNGRTYNEPD